MPKTKAKEKMVLISVHIPKQMLEELDEFVKQGIFPSRSEAIRIAIRDLLYRENSRSKTQNVEDLILLPGR
ncbi:MAG: ribbon-helix-helix domain-containing protein [Vulcanisaeta sp.]|jgi:Arc/MetJ-type ribon-helix-helix transcriptional regulator|uniref:Putative transcriptional regulator, CopG family n=1 Tax=Vulcanisaeta distributa (strain DSM 14429 / JCM 11212 / NBRC 100878 / IC-017) TaxID=572478 RepID=E1QRT5_VULDI|nr:MULTISPECIES: ribbon-helix-helix domain-containing protein [Vulcanisaeta]KUO80812.1 MAG: CopG family transcriptional regulator [Vulcanisaeta sp. JCHS_4]KUO88997.1 MAG: CopG family transcriptional regulator [Vulcanisaeta sp. MG_3]MCG2864526.1 ribbon-helix-helix domain-containing protein [Vulcanisaeta sp.]PVU72190.1 ribbon-helix-helix protein, CopG family [Vulcanisaeta sp. SCGC AB-777_J10]ADN49460.1 putative transcriptional regulator, CopG family [Vulcanisaeta distributa DSM 14429]